MNLEEFLQTPKLRNAWLREPHLSVYVRRGTHYINGMLVQTLDVANASVDESRRGEGVFTAFLERVEALDENIYLENVLEHRLQEFYRTRGYLVVASFDPSLPVCSFVRMSPNQGETRESI